MSLEDDLNATNLYYVETDMAVVYKKPTPIQITKINYHSSTNKRIADGFFKAPSTTDYNGVYNGYYLDFEAKETKSKTSFPLTNIHQHQLDHLTKVIKQKGIAFIIVRFTALNKDFFYLGADLLSYIKSNHRKSIPLEEFEKTGIEIKIKYQPRIDYIKIIKKIIEEDTDGNFKK